jgi:hypothetical protein
MTKRVQLALSLSVLATLSLVPPSALRAAKRHASRAVQSAALDQTPLTPGQIRELITRTIENQHRDDTALDSFERVEHQVTRAGKPSNLATDDRTFRVVPTGSGTLHLLAAQNGVPVAPAFYQRQLRQWEGILEVAVHSQDPREVAVVAKQQKRRKERARFVDAVPNAYQITWLAREFRDGRVVEKLQLDPNPNYLPRGDTTDLLTHARAIVWIDPQAGQVVCVDATIIRDISVGAGVLGKIYRGGHFHMEQAPAAPDLWEPTLYQYDISGRKFLFSFVIHEATSSSHYVQFGTPDQALVEARDDLAHCCSTLKDPL